MANNTPKPMSAEQWTDDELLRAEQTIRDLFARDGKARPSIRVLLMQIDRLRVVVAERDAENARLRGWLSVIEAADGYYAFELAGHALAGEAVPE